MHDDHRAQASRAVDTGASPEPAFPVSRSSSVQTLSSVPAYGSTVTITR